MLDEAIIIGDKLIENSIQQNEFISWNLKRYDKKGTIVLDYSPHDFYSGNAGISFFLFQLFVATKDEKYKIAAKKSCVWRSNVKRFNYPSFFSGSYGCAYTDLLIFGSQSVAFKIIAESNENDVVGFDVISGHAGCIIILIKILTEFELNENQDLLIQNKIKAHLGLMLKSIGFSKSDIVFKSHLFEVWSGFSHGQSGAEYVLRLLNELYDKEELIMLADLISTFEENTFSAKFNNYLDLRCRLYANEDFANLNFDEIVLEKRNQSHMHAWCHGLPGITLAKSVFFEKSKSVEHTYDRNYEMMKNNIEYYSKDNDLSLCHGISGNLDIFHVPEFQSKMDEISFEIKNNVAKLLLNKENDYSLMSGIAGIGYFFLRRVNPIKFKSILIPVDISLLNKFKCSKKIVNFSMDNLLTNSHYTVLQKSLFDSLKKIKDKKPHSNLEIKNSILANTEMIWEIKKDEFKTSYDIDFQKHSDLIVADNKLYLQDFLSSDNHTRELNYTFENNYITSSENNEILFYLNNKFHQLKLSDFEINFLLNKKCIHTKAKSEISDDVHNNLIKQMSQIGLLKLI